MNIWSLTEKDEITVLESRDLAKELQGKYRAELGSDILGMAS